MKYWQRGRDLRSNSHWRYASEEKPSDTFYYKPLPSQTNCIITNKLEGSLALGVVDNITPKLKTRFFAKSNQHYILDAFKHWFYSDRTIKVTPEQYWFHYTLSQIDNRLLRLVTENKAGYSFIAGRALIEQLDNALYKNPDLEKQLEELNRKLKNGEDYSTDSAKNQLDKLIGRVKNRIKREIDKVESVDKEAGKGNTIQDVEIMDLLLDNNIAKLINIKERDIHKFINTTIDRAIESVGGKPDIQEEDLFESDDIEDLVNVENFSHIALLEELSVRHKKYHISFDIYIDDSGSMTSSTRIGDTSIRLDKLARLVAYRLYKLNLLRKIYLFSHENTLTEIKLQDLFVAKIDGGTDFKQCIKHARKRSRPSIIITDGCDHIDKDKDYNKNIFFLVLEQNRMSNCFINYVKNKKLCFYSRGRLYDPQIDSDGYISSKERL
jgi:uncharacterized protein YkvS